MERLSLTEPKTCLCRSATRLSLCQDLTQHVMKVVGGMCAGRQSDLRHAEVRRVGAPVGPQAVLQRNLFALQGVHQIPELGGRPHAPGAAGPAHHRVAVVAAELQVV